jgi:hypothetical protein
MIEAMSDLDLQYPVGKPARPQTLSAEERADAIETLAALPKKLAEAVDGLNDAQLDTPYRPGGWTIRKLVHHIADSHMNAYARMRLALTENWPAIFAYDQDAWARLADAQLPPALSLQIAAWTAGSHFAGGAGCRLGVAGVYASGEWQPDAGTGAGAVRVARAAPPGAHRELPPTRGMAVKETCAVANTGA